MIRIVKLTFQPQNISNFLQEFKERKYLIETFEGCQSVTLLRDIYNSNVFFTYSIWANESNLEAYRKSALFGTVWKTVKVWFSAKAEAWSVEEI